MTEAPAPQGSTALALAPARPGVHLRLVAAPSTPAPASTSASTSAGEHQHSPREPERPLTLTRRGRLLLVGLPIALGVAALILLGAFLTSQAQAGESAPVSSSVVDVNVAAGETLWDLAVRYAPDRDPRDVVTEMVELNNLRSSVVQAGQSISIPAEG
ncbi:LysM peptidoglycan-binding domain-containing protein [Arthrobacter sp. TmT3-37]